MSIKIIHLINETYQVIEFNANGEIDTICFQGSLSDCSAYMDHFLDNRDEYTEMIDKYQDE